MSVCVSMSANMARRTLYCICDWKSRIEEEEEEEKELVCLFDRSSSRGTDVRRVSDLQ